MSKEKYFAKTNSNNTLLFIHILNYIFAIY